MRVRFGVFDSPLTQRFRQPTDYRSGKNYAEFDVALLTLTQRVEFSDFIQPICLPAVETKVFY